MSNWKTYKNGNYTVKINLDNGTKIKKTKDDEFISDFATNIDIKICNRCDMVCSFCHEGSTPDGKLGDILNEKFIETLHPYQEIALGGGNVLEHPDLIVFLMKLKNKKAITNITLHQIHFEENVDLIERLVNEKMVYGIGVSLMVATDDFIQKIRKFPNAIIHVINGIVTENDINKLSNHGLKLLILGYKHLRRGDEWYKKVKLHIDLSQEWLKKELLNVLNNFEIVSFDNLAIEQLNVKSLLTNEEWEEFYAGEEGSSTFYIDMVERKFARNSTAAFDKRYELLNSVDEMFQVIKDENKK